MWLRSIVITLGLVASVHRAGAGTAADLRIAVRQGFKWGFVDGTGKVAIPFWFTNFSDFHNGVGCADNHYIDTTGRKLFDRDLGSSCSTEYDMVPLPSSFGEPMGLLDRGGKPTWLPLDIDNIGGAMGGLVAAFSHSQGLWGYADVHGTWVIKPQFGTPRTADERKAAAQCDDAAPKPHMSWDVVHACDAIYAKPLSDIAAYGFSEGRAAVRVNGRWGFVDTTGKQVIAPKWKYVTGFSQGHAIVTLDDDTVQIIDATGAATPPAAFKQATTFSEGFAIVEDTSGFHFIDEHGKTPFATPAGATLHSTFSNGRALAYLAGRTGYLDKSGGWAIQPRFAFGSTSFVDGFARVDLFDSPGNGNRYDALIDTAGKVVWVEPGGQRELDRWAGWKAGDPEPKRLAATPPPPEPTPPPAASRFVVDPRDPDAIDDLWTGREWSAHDNGADIDFNGAVAYARAYRGGGHEDWELPYGADVAELVVAKLAHHEANDCTGGKSYYVIAPLVHLSCGIVWTTDGGEAGQGGFGFISGTQRAADRHDTKNYRVLVVRHL